VPVVSAHFRFHSFSSLPETERSIVMSVSVCLSVCWNVCLREHISGTTPDLYKLLCTLPMAEDRSSSGGVAIRYALPVLWMTPYLHIMHGPYEGMK